MAATKDTVARNLVGALQIYLSLLPILSTTATGTACPSLGQYQPEVVISRVFKKVDLRAKHRHLTSSARLNFSHLAVLATGDAASADIVPYDLAPSCEHSPRLS